MAVGDLEIWDKKGHFESPGRSCCFFAEQIYPRVILLPIESVVWYVIFIRGKYRNQPFIRVSI